MAAVMMHETIWFDGYKYDEAEERYQAHLAGVSLDTPVKTQGSPSASSSVKEIAEARRKIQQTLSGAPAVNPSSSTSEKRIAELEAQNTHLSKVTEELAAAVKKLEQRVAQLECGKSAPTSSQAQVKQEEKEEDDDDDFELFGSDDEEKPKKEEEQKKTDDDDDDFELFGSDDDDEDEEKEKETAARIAAYQAKKSNKPKIAAKSTIVLDIKPWDDETDMKELERLVRSIEKDGLLWGASKILPVAYGIMKLQINCIVEDEKVGTDDLNDAIVDFEEYVQSVDVVAFNKI